ncbi:MAG: DMT family transporter [Hyphomicrobiaceae bacterium]|nr:MAG: DMT family transporter [Hyphomicrobiaceae bacterium]
MSTPAWLWIVLTLIASIGQVARNAMQRELTSKLGTVGATHVRFLFGLPFSLLFIFVVLLVAQASFPPVTLKAQLWVAGGAMAQIIATALMLAAMKERSFVVTTALIKVEPVWVALFGLVFLGDRLTPGLAIAILIATAGVSVTSWPKRGAAGKIEWGVRPIALGLLAGAMFGVAAVAFRGGILEVRAPVDPGFVVAASTVLAIALAIQTVVLTGFLVLFDRPVLAAIFRQWRPSMLAGFTGALASQFWFLAFAIESAARVRTLALVEVLMAQIVSRNLFRQSLIGRETIGIVLIVIGVLVLLNL